MRIIDTTSLCQLEGGKPDVLIHWRVFSSRRIQTCVTGGSGIPWWFKMPGNITNKKNYIYFNDIHNPSKLVVKTADDNHMRTISALIPTEYFISVTLDWWITLDPEQITHTSYTVPSHYLNHWWTILNWYKHKWHLNQNRNISFNKMFLKMSCLLQNSSKFSQSSICQID